MHDRSDVSITTVSYTHLVQSPILNGGWHLLGTARMGMVPERSVVNEWGRSHDVKNLFIVDGSIFVTSGGVNPTCTIQALEMCIRDRRHPERDRDGND